jgi:hypothetical protein
MWAPIAQVITKNSKVVRYRGRVDPSSISVISGVARKANVNNRKQ